MVKKYDEKSAGIVLFREEKGEAFFLLLHYLGGHWDFPKGHIEKGEDEHQAALRELEEETSIQDITFIPNFRHSIDYRYKRAGRQSHKQVIFFLGKTVSKEIKLSHEHQGYAWVNYEEALKRASFESGKNLLKQAGKIIKNA